MARRKRTSYREIQNIPFKDIDASRRSIPFLRRIEQQNIREGELPGRKVQFVKTTAIAAGDPVTLDANVAVPVTINLTVNNAGSIIAWPQINVYVDDAAGGPDNLWVDGANLSTNDKNLQLGFIQQINTTERSGLAPSQASFAGIITNRDSSTHIYTVFARWSYLIIQ